MGTKRFKSIHIDTEKSIYLLNGKKMDCVQYLALEFEKGEWSLSITKDEFYYRQQPVRLRYELGLKACLKEWTRRFRLPMDCVPWTAKNF